MPQDPKPQGGKPQGRGRGRPRENRGGPPRGHRPRRQGFDNDRPARRGGTAVRGRYRVQQIPQGPSAQARRARERDKRGVASAVDDWWETAALVKTEDQAIENTRESLAMDEWWETAAQVKTEPAAAEQTSRDEKDNRDIPTSTDDWWERAAQVQNEEQTSQAVEKDMQDSPAADEWLESAAQTENDTVMAETAIKDESVLSETADKTLEVTEASAPDDTLPAVTKPEIVENKTSAETKTPPLEFDQQAAYKYDESTKLDIELDHLPEAELTPDDALSVTARAAPVETSDLEPSTKMAALLDCRDSQERSPLRRLPGEIRHKIYEYIFDTHRVEIVRARAKDPDRPKRIRYRLQHRQLPPRDPQTHAVPSSCGSRPAPFPPLPLSLVFTCKEMYRETLLFLYSTTQFVFSSTKAIHSFLRHTAPEAQGAIRHLELNHVMYNEPRLTAFRPFKGRSDMAWYLACHGMAHAFTSLRELHLDLTVGDWPVRLELGERWALPPLLFKGGGGLEYVDVTLRVKMFKEEKVRSVARQLEQALMKPEAWQRKEDERLAREKMAQALKARHVLVITV